MKESTRKGESYRHEAPVGKKNSGGQKEIKGSRARLEGERNPVC